MQSAIQFYLFVGRNSRLLKTGVAALPKVNFFEKV